MIQKYMIALLGVAAAQVGVNAPPTAPELPPVVIGGPAISQKIITWRTGPILCDGTARVSALLPEPGPDTGWTEGRGLGPVTFAFAIDEAGRPHAINPRTLIAPFSADLEPTLAAAQFKPGAPAQHCEITYTPTFTDSNSAPVDALIDLSLFPPRYPPVPAASFVRIRPAGSDCFAPQPVPRTRVYPDFKAIPQASGTRSWTVVGFDLDSQGRPQRVTISHSTGNQALDAAAAKAVAQSRFEPGARRGCQAPFWRTGNVLPAPPVPDALQPSARSNCTQTTTWKRRPNPVFPDSFRRRAVEGWAVVGYDIASWGALGNLRIIASEPASEFGEAALRAMQVAKTEPGPQERIGCVTVVRFKLADEPPIAPTPARGDISPPL